MPAKSENHFRIAVVVPCYNSESSLAETLDSLAAQQCDEPWELVLVDNMSTDSSLKIAESYKERIPNLRTINANEGQGTAYAINKGVESARSEFVIFCDSDDVPQPGWLSAMAEASKTAEFIACRMDVTSLNESNELGDRPTPQTKGLMKISYPPYLYHAGGSTLGVQRQLFLDIGGYDPTYIYLHETDFCFRVQLAGHTLQFVPDAVLSIRFRRNRWPTFKQSYSWGKYNVLLFKNYQHLGRMPERRWKRLILETRYIFSLLIKWPKFDNNERMRTTWLAGWYFGKLAGMMKYRSGPY